MTLTDFLLARIAEDEAVARQSDPHHNDDIDDWDAQTDAEARWDRQPHGQRCGWRLGEGISDTCECDYPARVLAECEAKRRIVALHRQAEIDCNETWREEYEGSLSSLYETMQALALPYADHPDYDQSWRL